MSYRITQANDRDTMEQVEDLLHREGIQKDANLDYTCAMLDEDYRAVATGSCFGNTLRCFAVRSDHQGEGLLNEIVSHLIQFQFERGNFHLFLYTKCESARFFRDLGFHEIARVEDSVVFMENRRAGFQSYLNALAKTGAPEKQAAALVMNANPFTLGHQYLAELAAAENEALHLFLVSEDASLVPWPVRKRLALEGTSHLHNIIYHDSGPYIISNATFPSYFLRDEAAVIESHARLDLAVFLEIAKALGIRRRYVGEEPFSQVTGIYNQIMQEELPKRGVECVVVPRKEQDGRAISASLVRQCIQSGDIGALAKLVPEPTLRYFQSAEAAPVIARIREAGDVAHY